MSVLLIFGYALSVFIGLCLGLLGGGGSIITVPVFVYLLKVEAHAAIAMSLAVVGVTSLVGAGMHQRQGNLRMRTAFFFGASGIVGAFLGSKLTYLVPPHVLLLIFGGLMLAMGTLMLLRRTPAGSDDAHGECSVPKCLLVGFGVGALTGFLGVGGGFLIVPALIFFGGLNMREAVGTSLLVIAINCAAGLLGHMAQGQFQMRLTLIVTALAAAGAVGGAALAQKISPGQLRKVFAVFVLVIAVFLIVKNLPLL